MVQSQTIRLAKLRKQKMNAVGKKTKLSRDFRNNYAQKARFKDGNIWLEPVKNETDITERGDQGRDQHQGTRPTPRDETDFTERGEQGRIKKHQGTRSTPDQSRDRSKKILLRTKKQVTLIA